MVNHIAKLKDGVIMNKNIWGFGFYMKTDKVLKVLRFIFMEEISQKKKPRYNLGVNYSLMDLS